MQWSPKPSRVRLQLPVLLSRRWYSRYGFVKLMCALSDGTQRLACDSLHLAPWHLRSFSTTAPRNRSSPYKLTRYVADSSRRQCGCPFTTRGDARLVPRCLEHRRHPHYPGNWFQCLLTRLGISMGARPLPTDYEIP